VTGLPANLNFPPSADCVPVFVELAVPTDDELHALLQNLIAQLIKLLTRRGLLVEEMG
jgi:hypothetical protein